ncbi:hypothetical protein OSTOST_16940, partial [Ostertagia ostertagi]
MLSRLPTNTYLLCLAAMSSLFLCTLFVFWLEEMSYLYFEDSLIGLQFRNLSCKVNQFFAHVCDFSSVWLIVLVGCERLMLLHQHRRSLTTEKACAQYKMLRHGVCDIDPAFDKVYHVMTVLEAHGLLFSAIEEDKHWDSAKPTPLMPELEPSYEQPNVFQL